MPTPLSPRGTRIGGHHPAIDIPGNIELVPLEINGGALSAQPHFTPNPSGSPEAVKPSNVVVTADDGGQAGYLLPSGSLAGAGDIYAAMTSYDTSVNIATPQTGGFNVLYAPTTHGPNGNCLELSTNYFNGFNTIGQTIREIQIWDFCANGWAGAQPMGPDFQDKYVRVFANGNGRPEYIAELAEGTDTRWHVYLYNNDNGYWDDIYQSARGETTNVLGQEGWSIFETHYESPGQTCSSLPVIAMSGLRLHYSNVSHEDWDYASRDDFSTYHYGDCFGVGGTITPYYVFNYAVAPDMSWGVPTE